MKGNVFVERLYFLVVVVLKIVFPSYFRFLVAVFRQVLSLGCLTIGHTFRWKKMIKIHTSGFCVDRPVLQEKPILPSGSFIMVPEYQYDNISAECRWKKKKNNILQFSKLKSLYICYNMNYCFVNLTNQIIIFNCMYILLFL